MYSFHTKYIFQPLSKPLCTVGESAFFARKKSFAPHSSRDSESRKAHSRSLCNLAGAQP